MRPPPAAQLTPERIARRSGSSFLVSFGQASPPRRAALTAVYAFCRVVDDAADDNDDLGQARDELAFWQQELETAAGPDAPQTAVARAVQQAMQAYGVRQEHLQNVIDGVRFDLDARPVANEAELERYCYCVAGSVGLACLPVFGAKGPHAEQYAVELGHALQLTNILRDLGSDAREGRVYTPRTVLEELGVERTWLEGDGSDDVFAADGPVGRLAAWLAARARRHYQAAEGLVDDADRRALLPAAIMGAVYFELLGRLEKLGGSVCRARRVRVPGWRKLMVARRVRRQVLALARA